MTRADRRGRGRIDRKEDMSMVMRADRWRGGQIDGDEDGSMDRRVGRWGRGRIDGSEARPMVRIRGRIRRQERGADVQRSRSVLWKTGRLTHHRCQPRQSPRRLSPCSSTQSCQSLAGSWFSSVPHPNVSRPLGSRKRTIGYAAPDRSTAAVFGRRSRLPSCWRKEC